MHWSWSWVHTFELTFAYAHIYTLGFLALNNLRYGVMLPSNYETCQLRSDMAGFHFALAGAKLPALRRMETTITECLRSKRVFSVSGGSILLY